MPSMSQLIEQYKLAKNNNNIEQFNILKNEIENYSLRDYPEATLGNFDFNAWQEKDENDRDFCQCLENAIPEDYDLLTSVFSKNANKIGFQQFNAFAKNKIFSKDKQSFVVNLFNIAEKKLPFKFNFIMSLMQEPPQIENWEEQLFPLVNFLDQKDIDEIYKYIFIYHPENVQFKEKLSTLRTISTETLVTENATTDLKNNNLTDAKLKSYIEKGVQLDVLAHEACRNNQYNEIRLILSAQPTLADETILLAAMRTYPSAYEIVDLLINQYKVKLNKAYSFNSSSPFDKNLTPFLIALAIGDARLIEIMLNSQQDLNLNYIVPQAISRESREIKNETALSYALNVGLSDTAKKIIERKDCDVTLPDNKPFKSAMITNQRNIALQIFQKTPKSSPFYAEQAKALNEIMLDALKRNEKETVKELLSVGFDWEFNSFEVLRQFLSYRHSQSDLTSNDVYFPMVELLIEKGVSISTILSIQRDIEEHSPEEKRHHNGSLLKLFDKITDGDIDAGSKYLAKIENYEPLSTFFKKLLDKDSPNVKKRMFNAFQKLPEDKQLNILTLIMDTINNGQLPVSIDAFFEVVSKLDLSENVKDQLFLIPALDETVQEREDIPVYERFTPDQKQSWLKGYKNYLPPSPKANFTVEAVNKMRKSPLSKDELTHYLDKGSYEEILFSAACENNREEEVKLFFERGKFNNADEEFEHLLWNNKVNILKVFLKYVPANANIIGSRENESYFRNLTPLFILLKINTVNKIDNHDMISAILEAGVDVNINHIVNHQADVQYVNESFLSYVISQGMDDLAERAIARSDIDVYIPDNKPFLIALKMGKYELAKKIQQKNPDKVKLSAEEGHRLLLEAIDKNDDKLVDNLMEFGVHWQFNNEEAVQRAIESNQDNIVERFVKQGMPQERIFYLAAKLGNWERVSKYIENGYPRSDHANHQALLAAIEQNATTAIDLLLRNGVKANTNSSEALIKAIINPIPQPNIVQMLIDCGADRKSQGYLLPLKVLEQYLNYPYDFENEQFAIIKILLKDIASPEVIDDILTGLSNGTVAPHGAKEIIQNLIKSALPKSAKAAFELLLITEEIKNLSRFEGESAMASSLTKRANILWKEMQEDKELKAKFESTPGKIAMEKVTAIEKNIKAYLLDEMLANAELRDDLASKTIKEFIDKHKNELIEGTDLAIMQSMRELMVSNDDNAQIAWRGYDQGMPKDRTDPGWQNLLTPSEDDSVAFTTATSFSGQITKKQASEELRTRMAYAFLATPKKQNFLQQLADIRRAPDHIHTPNMDSPTCPPGGIGRWGKIFAKGNEFGKFVLPPERLEIMLSVVNELVLDEYKRKIETLDAADIDKLYYALTILTDTVALDVISGKVDFEEELVDLRQNFISSLPKFEEVLAKVNAVLAKEKEEPLSNHELTYLRSELLELGASGRSHEMADKRKLAKEKLAKAHLDLAKEEEIELPEIIFNPYTITPMTARFLTPAKVEKRLKDYIEFEMLFPMVAIKCQELKLSNKKAAEMGEFLVAEISSSSLTLTEDRMKEAVKSFFAKYNADLKLKDQDELLKLLESTSSYYGLNESQLDKVKSVLEEKLISKSDMDKSYNDKIRGSMNKIFTELTSIKDEVKPRQKP